MFSIFWPVKLVTGLIKALLNLLVFVSCVLTIASLMGDRGWLWSLSTHFHVQYLAIQLAALLVISGSFWMKGRQKQSLPSRFDTWLNLVALMFFAGVNLSLIAPYYWPSAEMPQSDAVSASPKLKLMHINLFGYLNHRKELVIDAIKNTDPDIIDLVEYTIPWKRELESAGVFRRYPYRVTGHADIGLYSKVPLRHTRLTYAVPTQRGASQANILAEFNLNHQPVTILVGHPSSPTQPSHLAWQQASFHQWEKERSRLGKNLLLVGDLNTAPWSVEFKQLLAKTGLRDSQRGFGLQPSWPTFIPFPIITRGRAILALPLGIPIDHVLISPNIQVLSRKTGPFVGSDHLPVTVELSLSH